MKHPARRSSLPSRKHSWCSRNARRRSSGGTTPDTLTNKPPALSVRVKEWTARSKTASSLADKYTASSSPFSKMRSKESSHADGKWRTLEHESWTLLHSCCFLGWIAINHVPEQIALSIDRGLGIVLRGELRVAGLEERVQERIVANARQENAVRLFVCCCPVVLFQVLLYDIPIVVPAVLVRGKVSATLVKVVPERFGAKARTRVSFVLLCFLLCIRIDSSGIRLCSLFGATTGITAASNGLMTIMEMLYSCSCSTVSTPMNRTAGKQEKKGGGEGNTDR